MWIPVALLFLMVGSSTGQKSYPREQMYKLAHANNYFAVNLHRKLVEDNQLNVFFSPFSVSSVLAMLYRGARGQTAEEFRKVLGYRKHNDSTIFSAVQYYLSEVVNKMNPEYHRIDSVSAMIIDNAFPLLPEYRTGIQDIFQAFVQDANIAEESAVVIDRMNTWAKIKTKGTITDLAESIDPEATLFLASAAYFKGDWKVKFDPEDTKIHPFYNEGNRFNKSDVLMMHAYAHIRYFEEESVAFTAVELHYEGRNISMVIYLPNEYDGLDELEKNMTASNMQFVRRTMYFMKVHLTMPKFKLKTDNSLSKPLKALGLKRIFNFGADLTGMIAESSNLALDEIKHKAKIEVNEKGTVAAAITRAIMTKSMPLKIPDPEFKVDHPFMFAIFDVRSNMILFMGRIKHFLDSTVA